MKLAPGSAFAVSVLACWRVSHLVAKEDVPPAVAELYEHMCPAGVYERQGDGLRINPPNCVDCKATDVLGPRWTPREGGSGPKYKRM